MQNTAFRLLQHGDPNDWLRPCALTPVDKFTTDDSNELDYIFFQNQDRSVIAGVWQSPPMEWRFDSGHPVHEMISVIFGSVTMIDDDGEEETFGPGDVFFIAKGKRCSWRNVETVRIQYTMTSGDGSIVQTLPPNGDL